MISKEMSLVEIEANVRKALAECSYWGEIPLSRNEYEYMCEYMASKRKEKSITAFVDWLFKLYPACTVTTMVFFMVYEYREDFWLPWGEKLGMNLSQNHQGIIGTKTLDTFKMFKMVIYEGDGHKYVTPIICQAGVPDRHLDDIFYALTTSRRFDAHETIAELKGWRATYIKKPLKRFIQMHEESALNLIVLVHDVMLDGEVNDKESYEGRIHEQYEEWKEINLNRKGGFNGKGAYQENPHLIMDDNKGLCMVLPEFILEDEYCDYVKWKIYADEDVIFSMECEVFNDGNSKHSLEKLVPIGTKDKYGVRIFDTESMGGDKLLKDWEVNGLGDFGYLLFGNNGKKRTDNMFTYDGGTLIVDEKLNGVQFNEIIANEIVMPNSEGIRTYNFIPEKSQANIIIGDVAGTVLSIKKNIRAELCGGKFLFGDNESGFIYSIYIEEPFISIEKKDGKIDNSISMILRNRDTGFKKTIEISEIEDLIDEDEKVKFKALRSFGLDEENYGRYSIKFYIKGLYKKEIEFAYIPEIEFDDAPQVLWPNEKGTFLTSGFRYKQPKDTLISFTSKVNTVTERHKGEFWHLIKSREPEEFVEGKITIGVCEEEIADGESQRLVIPFRKRIRNVQWMLWQEEELDCELSYGEGRLDIKELDKANWLLSFSLKKPEEGEEYYLALMSSEGQEIQRVQVRPSAKGKWHVGLSAFAASIEGRKLPLTVVFKKISAEEDVVFKLVDIYESIILRGLSVKNFHIKNDEEEELTIQSISWLPTPADYDMESLVIKSFMDYDMEDIPFRGIRKAKKTDGTVINLMPFSNPLPTGLYKVAYGEEDFFDFGFDEFEPPVLTFENTFFVGKKMMLSGFEGGGIAGLLDAVTASYKNEHDLKRFISMAEEADYSGSLNTNQFRRLIVLARFGLLEPNGKCEQHLLVLLKIIKENLCESDKSILLDTIIGVEIKEYEKKKLIDFFGLYYVVTNSVSKEKVDSIMSIDTFLGTRSVMKCERSQWVLHSLTSSLGFDIIKKMMTKLPDGTIKVEATYDMFGDTDYFYNMFDWETVMKLKNYRPPTLDIKKKPEDELIFWGDGFINLMIRWYSRGFGKHPEIEKAMCKLAPEIERIASGVAKIFDEGVQDYFSKTIERTPQNNGGFYPMIASSVKAGMLFALHDFGKIKLPKDNLKILMSFVEGMNVVFPELIKRDILMAELFLYLKEV